MCSTDRRSIDLTGSHLIRGVAGKAHGCVVAGPHDRLASGVLASYQNTTTVLCLVVPLPGDKTMKIFNWMHRKLYPNVKYNHVSGKKDVYEGDKGKKLEILDSMEQKALLFHDALDSILTIGTLGSQVMFVSESYGAKEDELPGEEEKYLEIEVTNKGTEVAPALVAGKPPSCIETSKLKFPVEVEEKKMEIVHEADTTERIQERPLLMEDKEKREQRTTLADLFAVDALTVNSLNEKPNKKMNVRLKQYSIIHDKKKMQHRKEAKWHTATAKGNTNKTTRKIQKLISKLLKKKVHPEMQSAR